MAKVKISAIRNTLQKLLVKKGVPFKEARIIANDYLEGELQGKHSHGLMAFPSLIQKMPEKRKKIKVLKKTNSLIVYDANENLGAVVGKQAVDWLTARTKKEAVGIAMIKNMTTWLRPASIAQQLADRGLIGIVVNNGGKPMTAPPGGFDPVVGTNPIGIGIPTSKEPILTDMATSVRAWGEVRKAERTGKNLPKEAYYDKKGKFAIKAKDAYSALPMGGYKGFALAMLIEILTGSLLDRDMGQHQMKGDYRTMTRGGFILAINPAKTTTNDKFRKANTRLVKEIKSSKKIKGVKEILVPGEKAMKTRSKNLKRGYLEIDTKLWEEMKEAKNIKS